MAQFNNTGGRLVKLTKANTNIDGPPFALLVGTAGTANIMDRAGQVCADVPLQKGYNPISILQLRTGGTADDIWALYEVG